jgi:hypothetical protein
LTALGLNCRGKCGEPLLRHQKLCSPTVWLLPTSRNTLSTPASPLSRSGKDGSSTSFLLPPSGNKPISDSHLVGSTGRRSEVGFVSERRPEPFLLSFKRAPPTGCWLWNPQFAPPFSLSESRVPKSSWRSLIPEAKIPPCSIEHVARIGVESTIVGRNLLPITLSRC